MRAALNDNFNIYPAVKSASKVLWWGVGFLTMVITNATVVSWTVSSYKSDYDHRLKAVEENMDSLKEVPAKLSNIEGKMDVILNDVLRK